MVGERGKDDMQSGSINASSHGEDEMIEDLSRDIVVECNPLRNTLAMHLDIMMKAIYSMGWIACF